MGIENIWQHDPTFAVHWSIKDIHFFEFGIRKFCTVSYISNLDGIKVVFVWMTKLQLQSKQITSKRIVSSKHLYYHYARIYEAIGRNSSKWTQHYVGLSKNFEVAQISEQNIWKILSFSYTVVCIKVRTASFPRFWKNHP